MLAAAPHQLRRPKAIIVPHAGYVYSGPVAASIYAPLAALRSMIRRVVLLGPTHRYAVDGLALSSSRAFSTPLGIVPVDQQAVAAIADLPQVIVSDAAHTQEHSLEVQLPFLQAVFGEFSLLPLAVGQATAQAVAEVLERVWGGDETLIVISSDLLALFALRGRTADRRENGRADSGSRCGESSAGVWRHTAQWPVARRPSSRLAGAITRPAQFGRYSRRQGTRGRLRGFRFS